MSENDMRARLVALIGATAAEMCLAECEVRFREPEVDSRDFMAAKAMHGRSNEPDGFFDVSPKWRAWLIAEARRHRLALDAAHDEGVREMEKALDDSNGHYGCVGKLVIYAAAARLLRAKNGG